MGLREPTRVGFWAHVRLLSSWHGPRAALKCSYGSDRVTRYGPVALRVRAAKSGARSSLWTGHVAGRLSPGGVPLGPVDARRFKVAPRCIGGRPIALPKCARVPAVRTRTKQSVATPTTRWEERELLPPFRIRDLVGGVRTIGRAHRARSRSRWARVWTARSHWSRPAAGPARGPRGAHPPACKAFRTSRRSPGPGRILGHELRVRSS